MEHAKLKGAASAPFYLPQGDECEVFAAAHANRLPVLLKGPTGCGKTRFVAHMAAKLGLPLYTVACHDDLSAADLIGRYLLEGRRDRLGRRAADPRRARRRHLLSRRGGGSPQGRDRRSSSVDR